MKNKKIAFMFSGQGSQFNKMGFELYENNKVFRSWMDRLSEQYAKYAGVDVVSYLYAADKQRGTVMDDITYTHPAIFMVQYALARTLIEQEICPDSVVGVSLGEYVALAVAEVITYQEALQMVAEQVRLLKSSSSSEGAMITVLENAQLYKRYDWMYENSYLIADNYEKHFVIACELEKADEIKKQLRNMHITSVRLPVHYAFHSEKIDILKKPYIDFLQNYTLQKPKCKIFSSMEGKKVSSIDKLYLWNVLREPMVFREAVLEMEKEEEYCYLDLGASGTLEAIVKNIVSKEKGQQVKGFLPIFSRELKQYQEVVSYCEEVKKMGEAKKKKAYLFPGQGSQSVGMGAGLFDEFPEITKEADEVLGYSIKELCLEDKEGILGITKYTQPALYVVNILEYLKKIKETGEKPDYVAGHSLGEYCALYAAGVFDFKTGLSIVKKRAELMNQATGGGMAAVIGLSKDEIASIIQKEHLDAIDIANLNTSKQVALSGYASDIADAKNIFEENGARAYVVLKVSGAFHSRYMRIALEEFEAFLDQFVYNRSEIPVISNYTARPYRYNAIKENMALQMVSTVKWCESMCYLMGKGVEDFVQIGPGNVIDGMTKRIKRESEPLVVDDEAELQAEKEEAARELEEKNRAEEQYK